MSIIIAISVMHKVKKTGSIDQNLYIDATEWCKALQKADLKLFTIPAKEVSW